MDLSHAEGEALPIDATKRRSWRHMMLLITTFTILTVVASTSIFQFLSDKMFPLSADLCFFGREIHHNWPLSRCVGRFVLLPPLLLIGWAQMAEQAALAYHVGSTMVQWKKSAKTKKCPFGSHGSPVDHLSSKFE